MLIWKNRAESAACLLITVFFVCIFTLAGYAKTIQVVASNNLLADLVREIGGDKVIVTPIVTASSCVHSYEPGAKDMKAVAKAEIYVEEGLGDDGWAARLIKSSGSKGLNVISAGQGLKGDSHGYFDLDVIEKMVDNIAQGFSRTFPSDASKYRKNAAAFRNKLDQLRTWIRKEIKPYRNVMLLCYSEAFADFLEAIGIKPVYVVEEYHEQDVSPKALAKASEVGKEKRVTAVIGDLNLPAVPRSLAKEIGCKVLLLYPTVPKGGAYITFYKKNVSALVDIVTR